jgi:hypothetical protein
VEAARSSGQVLIRNNKVDCEIPLVYALPCKRYLDLCNLEVHSIKVNSILKRAMPNYIGDSYQLGPIVNVEEKPQAKKWLGTDLFQFRNESVVIFWKECSSDLSSLIGYVSLPVNIDHFSE